MNALRFEIRLPDGRKEVMVIEAFRCLVGSGAHCDVRLPIDQAAAEHVLIEVAGTSVRAEARAFEPPTLLGGVPYQAQYISPETPLTVGNVTIYVSRVDSTALGPGGAQQKKTETSPILKIAALVVFPAGAYLALADDGGGIPDAPLELPDIWAQTVEACPQQAQDRARALAEQSMLQAEGKRERSPFAPQEGITAVQLFQTASACYKAAGRPDMQKEAATAATSLKAVIMSDYRARRVRLEHSLKVEDWELAKRDVRVLRALTEGRKGEYITWLADVQRQVKQQTGGPAE